PAPACPVRVRAVREQGWRPTRLLRPARPRTGTGPPAESAAHAPPEARTEVRTSGLTAHLTRPAGGGPAGGEPSGRIPARRRRVLGAATVLALLLVAAGVLAVTRLGGRAAACDITGHGDLHAAITVEETVTRGTPCPEAGILEP